MTSKELKMKGSCTSINTNALFIIAFVLMNFTAAIGELILTINGFNASTEPVDIHGKSNIVIAIEGECENCTGPISISTEAGALEPTEDPNATDENSTIRKYSYNFTCSEACLDSINLYAGNEHLYHLVLFYIPEVDTTSAFGINKNQLYLINQEQLSSQVDTETSAEQQASSTNMGQQVHGSPIYSSSFCPDLYRDDIVNFIDFAIFAGNWLKVGSGLDGDFDNNGEVNEIDLDNFIYYWLIEHPIVAEDYNAVVTENQAVVITLNAYDCNGGGDLAFEIIDEPQNGILAVDANRAIYCPDMNYVGEDYFTYVASAGTSQSNLATVFITVLADTDDDGLSDYDEINGTSGYVTDPLDPNTDADTIPDGWEVYYNLNPIVRFQSR